MPIEEAMSSVEDALQEAAAHLSRAKAAVEGRLSDRNLPSYMKDRLRGLQEALSAAPGSLTYRIESVRRALPERSQWPISPNARRLF